ncbi:MarR family winged helix-turn-helix transcriptional regulator [Celeribacter neptunius]|uniref:DNA-binding transcriptional regulator, MarR family n=1 Tax=Celeribacter neptunius TaxID=588602 RepID=A0A1I3WD85_9RHOB|nr:MarR family transcriptional regulator [Celeribacter neptunius]SFK05159.1 DNA-binding transcriptional regulator, MarR family [Celeribacter neptunius]
MKKPLETKEITDRNLRQFVGYNMKRAFLAVREDLAQHLEALGLRMTSFSALAVIIENPDISQSRLAEALKIERSGVVVLVDELESADLIERGRVEGDRRQYALRATPAGEARWQAAEKAVQAHEDGIFAALTAEERRTLKALLGRVRRAT